MEDNRSTFKRFFFDKKEKIDIGLFTKKELYIYRLGEFTRWLTHFLWFSFYTTLAIMGYYTIANINVNNEAEKVFKDTTLTFNIIGHATFAGLQGVIGWVSKNKVSKTIKKNGNPVFKKSVVGIIFIVISLLPPIIYVIGRIWIFFKFKEEPNEQVFIPQREIDKIEEHPDMLEEAIKTIGTTISKSKSN